MDLTTFILERYCRISTSRRALLKIIKEDTSMNQTTRDALQRIADNLTAEIEEIRQIVASGGDSTELDAHLNTIADNISNMSEAIKNDNT